MTNTSTVDTPMTPSLADEADASAHEVERRQENLPAEATVDDHDDGHVIRGYN
jgi:hypothetical protein